jgi:hypothetical protein
VLAISECRLVSCTPLQIVRRAYLDKTDVIMCCVKSVESWIGVCAELRTARRLRYRYMYSSALLGSRATAVRRILPGSQERAFATIAGLGESSSPDLGSPKSIVSRSRLSLVSVLHGCVTAPLALLWARASHLCSGLPGLFTYQSSCLALHSPSSCLLRGCTWGKSLKLSSTSSSWMSRRRNYNFTSWAMVTSVAPCLTPFRRCTMRAFAQGPDWEWSS